MLLASSGVSGSTSKTYADDCFGVQLRTGNGTSQSVTTGFQPDLVWTKSRSATTGHRLVDSARGAGNSLESNSTLAQQSEATGITAFNASGYSVGADSDYNTNTSTYVDWVWKKAPKFFDVVTYTGDGVAGRQIPHNLGVAPGMIIFKDCTNTFDWQVWHKDIGVSNRLRLNQNFAVDVNTLLNGILPTSTNITLSGNGYGVNQTGANFVAYIFAHDSSADGIIQCGSFTTDASGNATVNLGWEPQYVLNKASSTTSNWFVVDSMRGMFVSGSDQRLGVNISAAEDTSSNVATTATGFNAVNMGASLTYIYVAIRRPNKPPKMGTQVFSVNTSNSAAGTDITAGFPVDLQISSSRSTFSGIVCDRLRGLSTTTTEGEKSLVTSTAAAEVNSLNKTRGFNNTGFQMPSYQGGGSTVFWNFKRAPGVFDAVCFTTATSASTTIAHNLTTTAELIIVKERNLTNDWFVYVQDGGVNKYLKLNADMAYQTFANKWAASSTGFGFAATGGNTAVAYLFATKVGISKVGSYTGNGSSQTINCGFSTGARFILIKRTDSTGDWYVWDTARGIVSANDPHLSLNTNTSTAEVTTDDSVDPDNTGFIVNQVAATNINVNNATYIYLAIA